MKTTFTDILYELALDGTLACVAAVMLVICTAVSVLITGHVLQF